MSHNRSISGKKIRDFRDLLAWQKAKELTVSIYKTTENYPESELYGLVSQMRRAAVSAPSNIAEGFGRFGSKDKGQFFAIASGSLSELETQLIISKDIGYISEVMYNKLQEQCTDTHKLINGLRRANKTKERSGAGLSGRSSNV